MSYAIVTPMLLSLLLPFGSSCWFLSHCCYLLISLLSLSSLLLSLLSLITAILVTGSAIHHDSLLFDAIQWPVFTPIWSLLILPRWPEYNHVGPKGNMWSLVTSEDNISFAVVGRVIKKGITLSLSLSFFCFHPSLSKPDYHKKL